MTANCAPVYNFYNCCCDDKATPAPNPGISGFFIWPVDNALIPMPKASQEPLFFGGVAVTIDADKRGFVGLQPIHRKAVLKEISVLRVFLLNRIDIPASYQGTVFLDIVAMDLFGVTARTLSASPVDYKLLSEKVWTPIPLTGVSSDLQIQDSEAVIARITFSAPDLPFPNQVRLQPALSAIGEFI